MPTHGWDSCEFRRNRRVRGGSIEVLRILSDSKEESIILKNIYK